MSFSLGLFLFCAVSVDSTCVACKREKMGGRKRLEKRLGGSGRSLFGGRERERDVREREEK